MLRISAKVRDDLPLTREEHEAWRPWIGIAPASSSSSSAVKRRKKKKRRLPRTSSRSLRGRANRRQRQWHACGAGFPGLPLRAVFPSVSGRLVMLCIMPGMDQKGFFKFVDIQGSGMCRVGFTGYDAPRVMFPSGVARPKMLRILAGMDQKDRCSGIYKAGIAGYNTPRAVLSFLVRRPMKLGIMAGILLKDSCSGSSMFKASFTGDCAPRAVFSSCSQAYGDSAPRAVFPSLSSGSRCSASWPVWTRRIVRHVQGLVCCAVLLLVVSGPRCPSSWPAWTTGQCGGSQVQFLDKVFYMPVGVL